MASMWQRICHDRPVLRTYRSQELTFRRRYHHRAWVQDETRRDRYSVKGAGQEDMKELRYTRGHHSPSQQPGDRAMSGSPPFPHRNCHRCMATVPVAPTSSGIPPMTRGQGKSRTHHSLQRSTVPRPSQIPHRPNRRPKSHHIIHPRQHHTRLHNSTRKTKFIPSLNHPALIIQPMRLLLR